eukprot:jgi/Hompol1/4252/HPOL_007010-RA
MPYSIVDSCTSVLMIPPAAFTAFTTAIRNSGGLPTSFSTTDTSQFLNGYYAMSVPASAFNWPALPTLAFDIAQDPATTSNGQAATFRIVLGPRQYIQPDPLGYYRMVVTSGSTSYALLGIPLFTSLSILLDRGNGRIGWSRVASQYLFCRNFINHVNEYQFDFIDYIYFSDFICTAINLCLFHHTHNPDCKHNFVSKRSNKFQEIWQRVSR